MTGFLPVHLAEANTATTHGGGDQIEIQLGHLCNNRCVFCVSGQMTERKMARLVPLDPIEAALRDGASRGITRLTLLGGEPTIQRSFLPALESAKALGFTDVIIFTNGVRLTQQGFLDDVLAIGDYTWRISIQGGNEAAHVDVTKRPASFRRIVQGIANLRARGQQVTANLCLNELNAASLPDFVPLVREHGIQQLHIDLMRPQDAGARTRQELLETMGRYGQQAPSIVAMLQGFDDEAPEFDVNIGNLPYCIAPAWADRIHHGGQTTRTFAADGRGTIGSGWDKYEHQSSDKVHRDACDDCVFRARCSGVFGLYADAHGWDEFVPVTAPALAQLDRRWGAFDLRASPLVEPLRAHPPGYRFVEQRHDHRERRIDLIYEADSGVPVIIEVHPMHGRRAVRLRNPWAWTDDLQLGGGVPQALQDWARERLPGTTTPAELDARSVARLVALLKGVKGKSWEGWSLAGRSRRPDGAVLRWTADGASVDVRVQARAGNPRLRLAVEAMDATPERVRPLLAGIQGVMRG